MRLVCFHLALLLAIGSVHSQEWSAPKVISTGGFNQHPDFTVDRSHVIHCVWAHQLGVNYVKIYYSRSSDHGDTWSPPQDISRNPIRWMDNPHIVADSYDHLHVVYDFNTGDYTATKIAYIHYDGSAWSTPVFISDSLPGPAMHNRLASDHNDKLYCFWFRGNIVYRTMENGVWSGYHQPYPADQHVIGVNRTVVDSQNDLYCVGVHHAKGQTSYDDRAVAFTMKNGNWSDLVELSDSLCWENTDVGLLPGNFPVYVWGQIRRDTVISQTANYMAETSSSGMTASVMLSSDANEAAITTDVHGQIHVVDSEFISDSVHQLVSYNPDQNGWNRSVIHEGDAVYAENMLKSDDTTIYLILQRLENNDPAELSIVFYKKLIPVTGCHEFQSINFQVYPNPFSGVLCMRLKVSGNQDMKVWLQDILGRTTIQIVNGKSQSGEMIFYLDSEKRNLSPGNYIAKVRVGSQVTSRKVILVR